MFRPPPGTVVDAQNLNCLSAEPVRHDERCPGDHQFACARNTAWPPHFRALRQRGLDAVDDASDNPLSSSRIMLGDLGAHGREIANGGWRPDRPHRFLGKGSSLFLPQESTHART